MYIFKTTLKKSNPQIIREFTANEKSDVAEFLKIFCIVHGWPADTFLRLKIGTTTIGEKTPLSELTFDNALIEKKSEPKSDGYNYTLDNFVANSVITFRLELQDRTSVSETPTLLRYRGINPEIQLGSAKQLNNLYHNMKQSGYGRVQYDYVYPDRYVVNTQQINRSLANLYRASQNVAGDFKVLRNRAARTADILSYNSVDALKYAIRENNLNIQYNIRKNQLVTKIAEYYDTQEFWGRFINEMTISEYISFKKLCQSADNSISVNLKGMLVFSRYALLPRNITGIFLPITLLDYYENFMNSVGDEELIAVKQIEAAILVCKKLYGLFDRDICSEIYCLLFPDSADEDLFAEEWEILIQNLRPYTFRNSVVSGGRYEGVINSDQVYFIKDNRIRANELAKSREYKKLSYYIPDKEEAKELIAEKLLVPQKIIDKITALLRQSYKYAPEYLSEVIAEGYHYGKTTEEILSTVRYYTYRIDFNKTLLQKLEKIRSEIRMVQLKGHRVKDLSEHIRINGRDY